MYIANIWMEVSSFPYDLISTKHTRYMRTIQKLMKGFFLFIEHIIFNSKWLTGLYLPESDHTAASLIMAHMQQKGGSEVVLFSVL